MAPHARERPVIFTAAGRGLRRRRSGAAGEGTAARRRATRACARGSAGRSPSPPRRAPPKSRGSKSGPNFWRKCATASSRHRVSASDSSPHRRSYSCHAASATARRNSKPTSSGGTSAALRRALRSKTRERMAALSTPETLLEAAVRSTKSGRSRWAESRMQRRPAQEPRQHSGRERSVLALDAATPAASGQNTIRSPRPCNTARTPPSATCRPRRRHHAGHADAARPPRPGGPSAAAHSRAPLSLRPDHLVGAGQATWAQKPVLRPCSARSRATKSSCVSNRP